MSYIELNIHNDQKYVSVWLTKAESADPALKESLKSLYSEYKQKKYRVVVFESGRGDPLLITLTSFDRFCVAVMSISKRLNTHT